MAIDIKKERDAFVTAYRLWCIEAHPDGHPEMVHSMAHSHWGRAAGAMWLAAKRHAAEVAEPVQNDELALTRLALDRAKRALIGAGFEDLGGEEWKPPLGKPPRFVYIAPAAPSGASVEGWQPIATAPKDGSEILLQIGDAWSTVEIASWVHNADRWEMRDKDYSLFANKDEEFGRPLPKYWRPLPSPAIDAAMSQNKEG